MPSAEVWDDAWKTRLSELIDGPYLSAGVIADILSGEFHRKFSRCGVIGKIHRLKLPWKVPLRREDRAMTIPRPRRRRPLNLLPPPPPPPEPEPQPLPEPPGVTFEELTLHTCRWPLGATYEPATRFCGRPVERPYGSCAQHQAMARRE